MCVVCAKYFKETGWVMVKNRDRAVKPKIKIKQSLRGGLERLLLWDSTSDWTEGLNEFGIGILSSALLVDKDEDLLLRREEDGDATGVNIRKALLGKTLDEVINKVIEYEITGNTLISDGTKMILIEGTLDLEDLPEIETYVYEKIEIPKDKIVVRTNHAKNMIAGYEELKDRDKHMYKAWTSSVNRLKQTEKMLKKITDPRDMFDPISQSDVHKDPQMNPMRITDKHNDKTFITTGQIMLVPREKTMHYRPIWCDIDLINFDALNGLKTKTWFEIISGRKLIAIKEDKTINILNKEFKMKFEKLIESVLDGTYVPKYINEDTNSLNEGEITDKKGLSEYANELADEAFGDEKDDKIVKEIVTNAIKKATKDGDIDWESAAGIVGNSIGNN